MNPLVLQMLGQAKDLLDSGQLTEADVENALVAQLQVPISLKPDEAWVPAGVQA